MTTLTIDTDSVTFAPVKLDLENLTVKPMDTGARKRLYLDFQYRTVVGYVATDFSFLYRGSRNVFLGTIRRETADVSELERYLSTDLMQAQLAAIVDGRDADQWLEQGIVDRVESLGQTLPAYWDACDWFQTSTDGDLFPAHFDGSADAFEDLTAVRLAEAKRLDAHLDADDLRRELRRRWQRATARLERLFDGDTDAQLFEGVDLSSLETATAGVQFMANVSGRSVAALRAYLAPRFERFTAGQ